MACNYYRVFVVILTAFCAFFAYICRLNLSLAIERMVLESNNQEGIELKDDITRYSDSYQFPPFIPIEEHILSKIFKVYYLDRITRTITNKRNTIEIQTKSKNLSRLIDTSSNHYQYPLKKNVDNLDNYNMKYGVVEEEKQKNSSRLTTQASVVDLNEESHDIFEEPLLDWDEKQRNTLLLSFFIGYVLFQIPLARAAEIFGPKPLFLIAALGSSFCSLIFPFVAKSSDGILLPCLIRVLMGLTQSGIFPAAYVLICEWMPINERAKWFSYPSSFGRFGTIVMNLIIPPILLNFGWQAVFYVSGLAILVWCVMFMIFGSNSPNESFWISNRELIYIETHKEPNVETVSAQKSISASGFSINEPEKKPDLSWKKLIFNKPILILTLVMFSSEWSNMLLLVKLAGFLDRALKFDLQEIGWWSSALVTIFCIHYPFSSYLALKIENSRVGFTPIRVRKIFEALAHIMQGAGCLLIAFYSDKIVVLSALVLMMLGRATVGGGQCLIPPELSKEYAGTVYAFGNTVANTAGVIGPGLINLLVDNQENHSSWFSLWIVSACLFFVAGFVFCLFADNSSQDYSKTSETSRGLTQATSESPLSAPNQLGEIFKLEAYKSAASDNPVHWGK